MGVFIDDFSNTYRTPYIPQTIVGFSGIDPSSPGDGGSVGLSEDEINALIALYVSNLKIRIDSGNISEDNPDVPYIDLDTKDIPHNNLDGLQGGQNGEYYHLTAAEYDKLKDYPLYAQLIASRLHEPLIDLLGGDANGHYHLTNDELAKLRGYPLYTQLIAAIKHEGLPDLLGGDANGHYHLTDDELDNLRKLIAALIRSGTVVIPSGGGGGTVVVPSGTDDHEQLQNLLGGDDNGHYHITDEEWTKLQALIAATFPSGSPTPVLPSTPDPSDPDPEDPAEDTDQDTDAGLPPSEPPSWGVAALPVNTALYEDAGNM